jgi:polyferredoxin
MTSPWQFEQRLSLRASTLLILYVPVLIGVAFLVQLMPRHIATVVLPYLGALGQCIPLLMVIAAVFALGIFLASIYRRRPQVQFFGEFLIGVGVVMFTPVY